MIFKSLLLLVLVILCADLKVKAQENHKKHECGGHPRNELGLGASAAYEVNHREWAPSFHLHYFRALTPHSRWALGGGIEYMKEEKRHFEIGLGVRYELIEKLHLTVVPGVTVTDKARFSVHSEVVYEVLHCGRFHLGPVAGYAWSKGHAHCSIGLHTAIGF